MRRFAERSRIGRDNSVFLRTAEHSHFPSRRSRAAAVAYLSTLISLGIFFPQGGQHRLAAVILGLRQGKAKQQVPSEDLLFRDRDDNHQRESENHHRHFLRRQEVGQRCCGGGKPDLPQREFHASHASKKGRKEHDAEADLLPNMPQCPADPLACFTAPTNSVIPHSAKSPSW